MARSQTRRSERLPNSGTPRNGVRLAILQFSISHSSMTRKPRAQHPGHFTMLFYMRMDVKQFSSMIEALMVFTVCCGGHQAGRYGRLQIRGCQKQCAHYLKQFHKLRYCKPDPFVFARVTFWKTCEKVW